MPSNKHNSRTARARDLISLLINVALSQDVFFTNCSSYSACIMVLSLYPFDLPSQPHKVTVFGRHAMASVRDINIAEALLTLCLAYYAMKPVNIAEIEALWLSRIYIWGVFHKHILRISHNGWMDYRDAFHAVLCLYSYVTDRNSWVWSVLAYGCSNN